MRILHIKCDLTQSWGAAVKMEKNNPDVSYITDSYLPALQTVGMDSERCLSGSEGLMKDAVKLHRGKEKSGRNYITGKPLLMAVVMGFYGASLHI